MREGTSPISPTSAPPPARYARLWWRWIAIPVVYLILFVLLDRASAVFRPAFGINPWYLPQGLSLALLVLGGLVYAPLVGLANFLVWWCWPLRDAQGAAILHVPLAVSMAVVVALGYLLAAIILRRVLRVDPRLARLRDVLNYVFVAFLTPLVTGALAMTVQLLLHVLERADFGPALATWWSGHIIGLLTITPVLLVHGAPWVRALGQSAGALAAGEQLAEAEEAAEEAHQRFSWRGMVEVLLWITAIAGVLALVTFMQVLDDDKLHLSYLSFLVLVWLALQRGIAGTSAGILLMTLGTMFCLTTFLGVRTAAGLREPQIFILTLSLTGLLAGVVVSERRRSERSVRASEDLLRTLIDAMPDSVNFKDGDGRWMAANEFGRWLFQVEKDEYLGRTDRELADRHPAQRSMFLACAETDERAWQQGGTARSEETITHPTGAQLTFDVIKVPLYYPDGRRKGLVVIGRDITERKQAEDALETERAYLSSAIDILPLPLAFLSPSGEWTQVNAAGAAFAKGLAPRQWLDSPMLLPGAQTVIPDDARPVLRSLHERALISAEVTLVLPDGRETPLLVHAGPIIVNDVLVAVVAAFQDITVLKEADKAKDEFLAILSHELLSPLADSLSWLHAANDTPEMTEQAVSIVERNVRLLHRVLTDLLDLSRITNGKMLLKREKLNLWDLVESVAREQQPLMRGRRRTLTLEPPDDDLRVSADRERLRQILNTLLAHALQQTEAGDTIVISATAVVHMAVLAVRDTGRGISDELLPHLFTPFTHVQATEPGRGMGVSLALMRGLAELHGGRLTAESLGADGNVLTLELPLWIAADD